MAQDGSSTSSWTYDSEGRRVTASTTGVGTGLYVYDAFGRLAAEYRDQPAAPAPCNTCYVATDYLGSTVLVTDENGTPVGRHDDLPFGEELPGNTAGRNGNFGTPDSVHQRYTGQERDDETGLDFFQARYFAATEMLGCPVPPGAGNRRTIFHTANTVM